jgi:hypothetical protein
MTATELQARLEDGIAKAEAMGCRLVRNGGYWFSPRDKCGCLNGVSAVGVSPGLASKWIGYPEIADALGLPVLTLDGIGGGFEGDRREWCRGVSPDYDAGYDAGRAIALKRFPDQFQETAP